MNNKCKLDTCSELLPSQCVIYTGELIDGTYINLPDCDPRLNDFLNEVDILLKGIKDNENILITDLLANNCNFTKITTLLSNVNNVDGLKVKTPATILTLLSIICDLEAEITALKNGEVFDILLTDEILSKLGCFSGLINDPCDGPKKILTLKDLLLIMITRLCCQPDCP